MRRLAFLSAVFVLACVTKAPAAFYTDATGDISGAIGSQPNLDIASVFVGNTATNLVFIINLVGDPVATDWGKYMVGIDSTAGGDTTGNGWGRPIGMSSGMDYWLGSWVDSGNGMELHTWNGSSWYLQAASYNANLPTPTKTTSSVTLTVPLSYLGLGVGSTIYFDVYSSGGGGGDGAVDALGNLNPSIGWWSDYYNSGSNISSYTVLPEPATFLVWGLALVTTSFAIKRVGAKQFV